MEKARGLELHNSVEHVMKERSLDIQGAINWLKKYAAGVHQGYHVHQAFIENVARMLSWGEDVEKRVKMYVFPESPYYNESDPHHTPSPPAQQDDSDKYTSTYQSIRSGSIWVTPSQRSKTSSIASDTRTALEGLYKTIMEKTPYDAL
jgi:hypothetical protein